MIEETPIKSEKPTEKIVIKDSGELPEDAVIETGKKVDEYGDGFESHPSDEDEDVHDPSVAMKVANELKTIGSSLFKKGDLVNAQKKCKSDLFARMQRRY